MMVLQIRKWQLDPSQVFSFLGPGSSTVIMTWFQVEGCSGLKIPPLRPPLVSLPPHSPGTTLLLESLPCHSMWQPHHTLTHTDTSTPFLNELLLGPNSIHLPQDSPGTHTPSGVLGYETVRKHNINYSLPTAQLQTTGSKDLLTSNFFRTLTAHSHKKLYLR